MSSPYFTEEHEAFREQIARFVADEVRPHADAWEEAGEVPRAVLRKMGELGFLGVRYSADYGGAEMDALGTAVLAEELGRSGLSGFAITVLVHTDMASPHLDRYGSEEQKAEWMPRIVSGEAICAVGVTEPGAGSDVAGLRTRAEKSGNGWLLNGAKLYITNGVLGDVYFIAARTDPEVKASRGVSMFVVPKETPGFSVAAKLDKMGWRCSDTAELVFEDCKLPADAILGEENRGFYQIMDNFQNERIAIGAMAVGEASRALEITLEHVKTRQAFGGALWERQAIRQKLAQCGARVEAARQLVYSAAWKDAQGADCVREVSMVKAFCAEVLQETVYACQQFFGGSGFMRGMEIERLYRDARVQAIGGGATEVMYEEVAKRM